MLRSLNVDDSDFLFIWLQTIDNGEISTVTQMLDGKSISEAIYITCGRIITLGPHLKYRSNTRSKVVLFLHLELPKRESTKDHGNCNGIHPHFRLCRPFASRKTWIHAWTESSCGGNFSSCLLEQTIVYMLHSWIQIWGQLKISQK